MARWNCRNLFLRLWRLSCEQPVAYEKGDGLALNRHGRRRREDIDNVYRERHISVGRRAGNRVRRNLHWCPGYFITGCNDRWTAIRPDGCLCRDRRRSAAGSAVDGPISMPIRLMPVAGRTEPDYPPWWGCVWLRCSRQNEFSVFVTDETGRRTFARTLREIRCCEMAAHSRQRISRPTS